MQGNARAAYFLGCGGVLVVLKLVGKMGSGFPELGYLGHDLESWALVTSFSSPLGLHNAGNGGGKRGKDRGGPNSGLCAEALIGGDQETGPSCPAVMRFSRSFLISKYTVFYKGRKTCSCVSEWNLPHPSVLRIGFRPRA